LLNILEWSCLLGAQPVGFSTCLDSIMVAELLRDKKIHWRFGWHTWNHYKPKGLEPLYAHPQFLLEKSSPWEEVELPTLGNVKWKYFDGCSFVLLFYV
jgi:hypothetical protein